MWCGISCARLISTRVPPAEDELRSGLGLVPAEQLLHPAQGGTFHACPTHPRQGFLPLAFHSPLEMDKCDEGQHLSGSCLEIRLCPSANQLCI